MKCLHGEPAATSTMENGTFWFCGQNPSCNFFCPKDVGHLFEKASDAWRATNQPHPECKEHCQLATMCVVKDIMKESYGRPYFVCSDKKNPCSFWVWGDVKALDPPMCRHGYPCVTRKVKKEGVNNGRRFFCCANEGEDSCRYFEWVLEEKRSISPKFIVFTRPSQRAEESYFKNCTGEFMHDLQNIK